MKTASVRVAKVIGMAIVVASVHAAISGVELPQQFLVKMMVKTQEDLQEAADSFAVYTMIATIWTVGSTILMIAEYGVPGVVAGLLANAIVYVWMFTEYKLLFDGIQKKFNLKPPKFF